MMIKYVQLKRYINNDLTCMSDCNDLTRVSDCTADNTHSDTRPDHFCISHLKDDK